MNTTITKDQMILHDGEVYVIENGITFDGRLKQYETMDLWGKQVIYIGTKIHPITHSTAKLDDVKHLQREWFVKGEQIDSNKEFAKLKGYSEEKFDNEEWSELYWFGAGITTALNAKKGEFTYEEAEALFNEGCRQGTGNYTLRTFDECVSILRPLQLPEKIVLSTDGELVEIQW